ncbi:hypothetical protein [Streptomyces sp. NPDC001492]
MTHIVVLGSTNTNLVTYAEKAPQREETVPVGNDAHGARVLTPAAVLSVQRPGAPASMPCRPEIEAQFAS